MHFILRHKSSNTTVETKIFYEGDAFVQQVGVQRPEAGKTTITHQSKLYPTYKEALNEQSQGILWLIQKGYVVVYNSTHADHVKD